MVLVFIVTVLLVIAQWILPTKIAFVPMLLAVCFIGNVNVISEFTPVRIIIITGLLRAISNGFFKWSASNRLDLLFLVFIVIAIISTIGHESSYYVPSPLIERVGLILNICGSYLYARAYASGNEFIPNISKQLAIIMIPLALLLSIEFKTGKNPLFVLGSRSLNAAMRDGEFRARGSFGHAIIAGTVTAASLPFLYFLFKRKKNLAIVGIVASLFATFSTGSSGPLATTFLSIVLLVMWRWRQYLCNVRNCIWFLLVILHFTMDRPVWFLIARIDLTGSSTGWHRALLMDAAVNDLQAWWLFGTDYTRHWIFSGVSWNPNHTDITNYYLQFGVLGGLPLMITFISIIIVALSQIEKSFKLFKMSNSDQEFAAWCLWSSIVLYCISFISIAFFDQSYALFFLLIGSVPGLKEIAEKQKFS